MKQQNEKRLSPFVWFSVALLALGGAVVTVKEVRTGLAARSWPEAKCQITKFDETYARKGRHHLSVAFSYAYQGQPYTSTSFSVSGNSTRDTDVFGQFTPGQEATCYVNPADPAQAFLHRKLGFWDWLMPPFALFLSLLMAGCGVGEVRRRRTERSGGSLAPPAAVIPPAPAAAENDDTRRAA